jgi:hypothetical protein
MLKTTFTITANRNLPEPKIWLDDKELVLANSLKIRNHSPSGFNWGYGGSGPAQTALAICLEAFKDVHMAESLYQLFKWTYVSTWKQDHFTIELDITDFLIDNRKLFQHTQ